MVGGVWPFLIILLVVVGLVTAVYLFGLGPEPSGRRDPGILRRRSKWRRWLPVPPLLAAVGCLALAFSGFTFSLQETTPITMLAMDASDSMLETDVATTGIRDRLEAAQAAAVDFLDELPPDFRVGLATFAGETALPVAPTQDRQAVIDALDTLSTSSGTVIGDGLNEALDAIEEARNEAAEIPAAVLLLSDGRDLGSDVSPHDAARRAQAMAVPVYTVIIGQAESGNGNEGAADPATLADIARTSGGKAFTADTADELTQHFTTIGSRLSVALEVRPNATPLVIGAIVLLVIAGFLVVLTPR